MLDRARDHVLARTLRAPHHTENAEIVSLGAAAYEDDLARIAMEQSRRLAPGHFEPLLGRLSIVMNARRVSIHFAHGRKQAVQHLARNRRSGVVIEIESLHGSTISLASMNMRTTKKLSITMPVGMVKDAEKMAKREKRTMSELVREALRQYKARREKEQQELISTNNTIAEAQREARENPMSREEALAESRRLARYGATEAKKLGIKTSDKEIVRLIHEHRAKRNA